jgi:hypothetical protein
VPTDDESGRHHRCGDPNQQAEMMAMRGEMMKAMGDIMLKYAQRAQSSE